MVENNKNEGTCIILYRHTLAVSEYRKICGLSGCDCTSLEGLKDQLAEPSGPGMDLWCCSLTELELLKVKVVDKALKVAIVTDGISAIICELPDSIDESLFVKVD